MHSGKSILTTSQNKNAKNVENDFDIVVRAVETKDSRLDNLGNANDFEWHKKDPQHISELIKKHLLMVLDAQSKRTRHIDYKIKEKNT